MEKEIREQGKYIIIYEQGSDKTPEYGSVTSVKVGDIVCIYDGSGHHDLLVDKITGSKWTKKIKTKASIYKGYVLNKSIIVNPRTIRRILRLKDGEKHVNSIDDVGIVDEYTSGE